MPRQPRLDAPGVLHHVMVRGIERTALFRDDRDHADFVAGVALRGLGRYDMRGDLLAQHFAEQCRYSP